MGALIDAVGAWVAVLVGVTIIVGGLYGAKRWAERGFNTAVAEVIAPLLGEINAKLDHLHDCVEGVKDTLVEDRATVEAHVESDAASFANINSRMDRDTDSARDERAELMSLLREIQAQRGPSVDRDGS